jgi:hypothetical protein
MVSAESIEQGAVIVRGSAAGFAQDIAAGHHRLTADEPVSAGNRHRTRSRSPARRSRLLHVDDHRDVCPPKGGPLPA